MKAEKAIDAILRNINDGFKSFLLTKNWVSSSTGFRISVAGGLLGIAGLALTLLRDHNLGLPWLSQRDDHVEKLFLVPGLQNLGNNCFLNVILQALASSSDFQPFLQKVMKECESSGVGELNENLQLTVALTNLLEELCAFGERRVVLSPREVMLAMAQYNQDFNLTNQQDAEEAFLHLLTSLREEFSDCYPSNQFSLVNSFASSGCRILTSERRDFQPEQKRWEQHFLGPFDGILSSILTCQSCASQISLNYQFFHSLPLSPVLRSGATIMIGCTLEDCLKKFVAAEQVENYKCSYCWHIAATKYLSIRIENEGQIEELRRCNGQDSCNCRSRFNLENLPWPNNSSRTLKQLSVARCPKILCIHLQRVTIDHFGELVKLQGYVAFPLILNMHPFMPERLQWQKSNSQGKIINVQSDIRMLNSFYGQNMYSNVSGDGITDSADLGSISGESDLRQTDACLKSLCTGVSFPSVDKDNAGCPVVSSEPLLYRLISVVEHFGRTGGGHYTVYRSARKISETNKEDNNESSDDSLSNWYCISDSKVTIVSEADVLAAEASLLFYERM